MRHLRRLVAVLLLLCSLLVPTLGEVKTGSDRLKRPSAVLVNEDDFNLTPEQEKLLFEDSSTSYTTLSPSPSHATISKQAAEKVETNKLIVGDSEENRTVHASSDPHIAPPFSPPQSSLPSTAPTATSATSPTVASSAPSLSPASTASCPDDFGGVSRLLSALFSPAAIRHSGSWSIHTSVTQSDYTTMTRLLRAHKAQDALDLLTMGERLLTSASYQSTTAAADTQQEAGRGGDTSSRAGEGPLTVSLLWLQRWAGRLERLLHHRLVAPLHLPSTASILLHGALVLLLPAAVFVALKMAAPVVVSAVSPRVQRRQLSLSQQSQHAAQSHSSSLLSPSSAASTVIAKRSPAAVPINRHAVGSRIARTSSTESFASALWIGLLLLLLTLFTAGYVHHYHTLHIEQVARNRILQSNPPPGCYQTNEPASLTALLTSLTTYMTRSRRDDACWRYEASLLQSSWPNPLLVLSSYLSTVLLHPLTHMGDAMGGFTSGFLSHHSIVMQGVMLAFLLAFSLGVVALCMVGGKACALRWCTGWGRRGGRSGVRDDRFAVRGGRRRREDSVRIQELIDREEADDESEEEEERERRQLLRRLLKNHKRREEEKQRKQLLLLMSSRREQEGAEDDEGEEAGEEESKDGRDERAEILTPSKARGQKCVSFQSEVKCETGRQREREQSDENSAAVKQVKQEEYCQQQQVVKKEEQERQTENMVASISSNSSSCSSSSPTPTMSASFSSPTSASSQLYIYPIARPSTEQHQRVPSEVKVKDEDELEWSGNPISTRQVGSGSSTGGSGSSGSSSSSSGV